MQITEKIIISSILILAVLLIRALFGKKVSPVFIYSLWLLAAVRILIPGMIFESPLSIMNTGLWKMGQKVISEENSRQAREYKEKTYQEYLERITERQEQAQKGAAASDIPSGEPKTEEITVSFRLRPVPTLFGRIAFWSVRLWLAGMAVTGVTFIWQNLSLYKYLRKTRKKLGEAGTGKRKIAVFAAGDKLPSPCLFGLFPSIYIPERCIGGEESRDKDERLCFILEHELTHYRHGDSVWSLIRMLCLIAAWYNPLVWIAAGLSLKDGELACDRGCLKRLGREKRIAYGEALLATVNPVRGQNALLWHTAMMTSHGKFMKRRIEGIAADRKSSGAAAIAVTVLTVLCVGAVFTGGNITETEETRGAQERTANTAF